MANYRSNNSNHHLLQNIGSKVKDVAELAGTLKGLYDLGKLAYSGVQVALSYLEAAALLV